MTLGPAFLCPGAQPFVVWMLNPDLATAHCLSAVLPQKVPEEVWKPWIRGSFKSLGSAGPGWVLQHCFLILSSVHRHRPSFWPYNPRPLSLGLKSTAQVPQSWIWRSAWPAGRNKEIWLHSNWILNPRSSQSPLSTVLLLLCGLGQDTWSPWACFLLCMSREL